VLVAVMQVRHLRMSVPHRLVHVFVDVRLGPFIAVVRVLVVLGV